MEVLDLTDLQRRGLLKRASLETQQTTPDVLDFTVPRVALPASASVAPAPASESSAFDFLSSFAQASGTPSNEASSVSPHHEGSSDLRLKMDGVVNKLEDVLYKLETLTSRIAQLESGLRNRDV